MAIAASSFMIYSIKQIKKKTKMQNTAKQLLSSASAGSVEIEAIAWPLKHIETSLSGEKVVFRFMELKKRVKRGKNSEWITVWKKYTTDSFLIFDQTGFAIVDPKTCAELETFSEGMINTSYDPYKFNPAQSEVFSGFYDGDISDFASRITSASGVNGFFSGLISSHYKLYERIIPVGSPLHIHGFYTPYDDVSKFVLIKNEFALFIERATKLISNKSYRLTLFDRNKNGSINREELSTGFKSALINSVKTDLTFTDLKSEGKAGEKLFGTIASSAHEELIISSGFEEQILNDNPIYINWLCLYLSAGILAFSIIFYIIM